MAEKPSATTHQVAYPFARSTYEAFDIDGPYIEECWRPGIRFEQINDDSYAVSDGMGAMLLEEVGRFKPGRYPERVFYVRSWIDPDGKQFGIKKLRMTTATTFARLIKGYRHPYYDESGDLVSPGESNG